MLILCLFSEGASDRLGVQEGEEPRECIGPHVPHGCDVSDHHWPHSGQRQVGRRSLQSEESFVQTDVFIVYFFFRCIRLALVHDMAECIVGDIAPSDNVSKEEKHRREEASEPRVQQLIIRTKTVKVDHFCFFLRKRWDTWQTFCPRDSNRRFLLFGRYFLWFYHLFATNLVWASCLSFLSTLRQYLGFWKDLCHMQEYEHQISPEARLVKQFDLLEMILQAHEYEELEGMPGRLQEFFDSTAGRSSRINKAISVFIYFWCVLTDFFFFTIRSVPPPRCSATARLFKRSEGKSRHRQHEE